MGCKHDTFDGTVKRRKTVKNQAVNLTKRIGTKYFPVVKAANGRIKDNNQAGTFYLDWRVDGKRMRLAVGQDSLAAYAARERKAAELNAVACGVQVVTAGKVE